VTRRERLPPHGWGGVAVILGDQVDVHGAVEMPILGYLGFPPFALECYAMYHAARGVLAAESDTRPTLI
jgi:hypothetical protein